MTTKTTHTAIVHVPDGHIACVLREDTLAQFQVTHALKPLGTAVQIGYHQRLRSAIKAAGFYWPHTSVIIRPVVHRLELHHDLPMALAILTASGQIRPPEGHHLGRLDLDGNIFSEDGHLRDWWGR